ncbi:MAG: ferrochelatase [Pirellulaceae bacterium]|nr:ferrochelatase [Pirellulaceae bacterium]
MNSDPIDTNLPYDALLVLSFGGPESGEDVLPFLENVLRGKNVPRSRMLEVAEHYYHFGGKSPINDQNRELISQLETAFTKEGIGLPIYWGNRNWYPLLPETLQKMAADGVKRALLFFTSAYSSYSGCRQYWENVDEAQKTLSTPISFDKLRGFYNHPLFIQAQVEKVNKAITALKGKTEKEGEGCEDSSDDPHVYFTAHSIPQTMANRSDYVAQLTETCRLVAERSRINNWQLVYQSRSGPPHQVWLGPDICDCLEELPARMRSDKAIEKKNPRVLIVPIGFLSDHLEVLYDLDTEAADVCQKENILMERAETVGTSSTFIEMVVSLVRERLDSKRTKEAIGRFPPSHEKCPHGCCPLR